MKKILAAILALFYLVNANGVGMNLHYCCGVLDHVELSYAVSTGDAACGMQAVYQGKNCCNNVHKAFRITQAHNTVSDGLYAGTLGQVAVVLPFSQAPLLSFQSIAKGRIFPHAPPLGEALPLYIKHCRFLI